MPIFRKSPGPQQLAVAMTGVTLGDRLLQIGCSDRTLVAALAAKVGLSGRAAVAVDNESEAGRAREAAARAGVLVEVEVTDNRSITCETGAVDLVVIDGTSAWLASLTPERRVSWLQEAYRVLRAGGRVVAIETAQRAGLGRLWSQPARDANYVSKGGAVAALQAEGFKAVRILAEREGLTFVEGMKPKG